MAIFTISQYLFQYFLSIFTFSHHFFSTNFVNIYVFWIFCPLEKCAVTPHCLYRDSLTLNSWILFGLSLQNVTKVCCYPAFFWKKEMCSNCTKLLAKVYKSSVVFQENIILVWNNFFIKLHHSFIQSQYAPRRLL